jgi:hypothetical protein
MGGTAVSTDADMNVWMSCKRTKSPSSLTPRVSVCTFMLEFQSKSQTGSASGRGTIFMRPDPLTALREVTRIPGGSSHSLFELIIEHPRSPVGLRKPVKNLIAGEGCNSCEFGRLGAASTLESVRILAAL